MNLGSRRNQLFVEKISLNFPYFSFFLPFAGQKEEKKGVLYIVLLLLQILCFSEAFYKPNYFHKLSQNFLTKITFLILGLYSIPCFSQSSNKIHFKNISVKEGLSFPVINCILQDSKGFLWVGTEIGLNKYDSQKFKTFYTNPSEPSSLPSDNIVCLFEDTKQQLWVGTTTGLAVFDRQTSSFKKFKDNTLKSSKIKAITGDSIGNIWVLSEQNLFQLTSMLEIKNHFSLRQISSEKNIQTLSTAKTDAQGNLWIYSNKGIRLFDSSKKQLTNPLNDTSDFAHTTLEFYSTIFFDKRGNFWVGVRGDGVKFYSITSKKWKHIKGISTKYVNGVYEDIDNNIWICTGRNGLDIYNPTTQQVEGIKFASSPESNLLSNSLSYIYGDRNGGIWIGTFNNGLLYYYQHQLKFNLYYSKGQINGISSNYTTSFSEDKQGNIWIGVGEEGLLFFNRKQSTFKKIRPPSHLFKTSSELRDNFYIFGLLHSSISNHLYIGTLTGFFDYDIDNDRWFFFSIKSKKQNILQNSYVNSLFQDKELIYLGMLNGIGVYNTQTKSIENYEVPLNEVAYLEQDEAFVYMATHSNGLWKFDKKTKKINKVKSPQPNIQLPQKIRSILVDNQKNILLGTYDNGLLRFNNDFSKVEKISNRLFNKRLTFMSICQDKHSAYWIGTNNGLLKITPEFKFTALYDQNDGFIPSYFSTNSIYNSQNNELFIGGNAGFYSLSPNSLGTTSNKTAKIQLIDFLVANKSVSDEEVGGFQIKGELEDTKNIVLPKYQSLITFEYSTLDFNNSLKGKFLYKLTPYDKDWNNVGNRRFATYRDLPPGTYTFMARFQSDGSLPSYETTNIKLTIPTIWWQSWWAYLCYFTLIFLLFREFYLYRRNKRKLSQEIEMQKFKNEKMEELYNFKIDFFTQVTHELRTPLTLIISPLEEIIRRNQNFSERNLLKIIHRNTQKLLLTVNQLLDFRKIENVDMKVFAKKGNIVAFVEEIFYSFLNLAEKKGIELMFDTNMEKYPFVLFDKDIIEKIVVNLVANAVKFTHQGSIQLRVFESEETKNPSNFFIEISDTGQGIKAENLKNVFDTFFQERRDKNVGGSGIGLKIVKELTTLHKGSIKVSSEIGKGTTFLLSFPKADLDLMNEEPTRPSLSREEATLEETPITNENRASSSKILLIDDEPDVLLFLEEIFDKEYQVFSADSAKKAIDIAKTELPDLIVSDVMMPEMNGFDLCEFVKKDFLLGHIPVVLLTALNATEHEIEGLKTGADAYISKPFSVNLLKATVQNLLSSRQKLKQAFLNSSINNAKELTQNNSDQLFIEKVIELVDKKLDKTDLELAEISEDLGMSQSTFYRKLKGLTDLSGNEFIRTIRLKRSVELLKTTNLNVSEIAYRVGFSDPKYFSTCFRKSYNITPTEFISQHRKEKTSFNLN